MQQTIYKRGPRELEIQYTTITDSQVKQDIGSVK